MKKLLLLFSVICFGSGSLHAQGDFKLGINGGLPVGDIEDYSSFQLGADAAYLFGISNVAQVGPMIGYSRFFAEDVDMGFGNIDMEDISFLPIAASGRFGLGIVFLGADLGYAVSLDDGGEGGFFYRPKIGVGVGGFSVIGSYQGISNDGESISSINIGVEFGL